MEKYFKISYSTEDGSRTVFIKAPTIEKALSIYRDNYNGEVFIITLEKEVDIIS